MREIGEILRRQREQRGASLREAQAATKIRLKYLEALEAGDEAAFPGEVYMKGFLRSYADYLGLDGWALVGQYRAWREAQEQAREAEARAAAQSRRRRRPAPATEGPPPAEEGGPSRRPPAGAEPRRGEAGEAGRGGRARAEGTRKTRRPLARPWSSRWLVLILIGVLVVALGVLVVVRALLPAPPELVPRGSPPAGVGSRGSGGAGAAPSPPAPSPSMPPPAGGGTTPQPGGPAGTSPPAVALVTGTPEAAEYTVAQAPLLLEAVAQERCWVRVEADGVLVSEETLSPGDRRRFEAFETLWLRAGNPGGLELVANGARLGPAGGVGVPRNLVFVVKSGG